MREGVGQVVPITLVLGFIVLISGYLSYTINYNKAFKMKNRIIYILEKYDNNPNGVNSSDRTKSAMTDIQEYAKEIGYNASGVYRSECGSGYSQDTTGVGWCYQVIEDNDYEYNSRYVKVKTFVSIDVPIFNYFFANLRLSQIEGATKKIISVNKK